MIEWQEADRGRRLSWAGLIGVIVSFGLLPAIVNVTVLKGRSDYVFPDQDSVRTLLIARSVGLLVAVVAVTALRWWPSVLRESLRTRLWVWVVPASLLVVAVALTDYGRLVTAGVLFSLTLAAATLCIAAGEELIFRGIVLRFLRLRYRELAAAIASSVAFGLMHFLAGPVNVVATMIFGFLLYLTRRVSGGILVPIAVHFAWDFSVFSSFTTAQANPDGSNASIALAIASLVLLIVAIAGHRYIPPNREQVAR